MSKLDKQTDELARQLRRLRERLKQGGRFTDQDAERLTRAVAPEVARRVYGRA